MAEQRDPGGTSESGATAPDREDPLCATTGGALCAQGMSVEECETLRARLTWLVRLRWFVLVGCSTLLAAGAALFPQGAHWRGLGATLLCLGIANAAWQRTIRLSSIRRCTTATRFAARQIAVDFFLLTIAVYLTGGILSPLVPLYVLHGVFSALLLPRRLALRVVILTVVLVAVSLAVNATGLPLPAWAFQPGGTGPQWASELLRFGCLAVAIGGATLQGLALSQEIRERHAKIARLARALEARNAELRRLDDQRVRLLSVASHDLRSPIAAVESQIDLFLGDYIPEVTEPQKAYLRRMRTRLKGLRGFVNDLLDLTAVESKRSALAETKRFDLVAQLREVVTEQETVATGLGLELVLETEQQQALVEASPAYLYLVWSNLVSNALKYSAGRSPVVVKLWCEGEHVKIAVSDKGLGISERDQARLFEDFFRAEAVRKTGLPGSGLGLAIVRRAVESAGGQISVESQLAQGTTFTVRLPRVQ